MTATAPSRRGAPQRVSPPIRTYLHPEVICALDVAARSEGLGRSAFARRAIIRAISASASVVTAEATR